MNLHHETVENIINLLRKCHDTVAFAESCTGGRIAAAFTSVAGASDVFDGSVVSYANAIKTRWLGVRAETLAQHGAVSRECVQEMLSGISEMAEAGFAVAVSGIAGPTGGTPSKPVGTVYIGIRSPKTETIHHCQFDGDREAIQEQSVTFALAHLAEVMADCYA